MKYFSQLFSCVFVLLALQACHNDSQKEKDAANAQRRSFAFMKNASINGLCEIKASGFAITNSNNHRVIDLAKMIITEQTAIDSQLVDLKKSFQVTSKDTIDAFDARWIDSLQKQSGPLFDQRYVTAMMGIHRADSLLYAIIAKGSGPAINKFAEKNLPLVTKHLDSAAAILKSLK